MGSVPQWLLVDVDGQPAVTVDVYQQDNADTLSLLARLREDQAPADEAQAVNLLSQSERLLSQTTTLLKSAQAS